MQLDVIFEPDTVDQPKLSLDKIDLVLFPVQHMAKQIAGGEIAHALAIGDRLAQTRDRGLFEPQIAFEHLAHILADQQLAEVL